MGQIENGSSLTRMLPGMVTDARGDGGVREQTLDDVRDGRCDPSANDDAWWYLPSPLTWAATVDADDPLDETEITEDMIARAIIEMEREQPWPFRQWRDDDGDTCGVRARAVRSADVLRFPGVS